jgi:hypothetical protein
MVASLEFRLAPLIGSRTRALEFVFFFRVRAKTCDPRRETQGAKTTRRPATDGVRKLKVLTVSPPVTCAVVVAATRSRS